MRFGSVCSGIEAASVAWHPLGWRAAWLAEIEPFPSAVLKHHYPEVPNLSDMTALPDRIRSGEVEAPDLFCGGTPCQAFSVAGLRRSLDDARGNLSLTFCEIADAIDSVRLAAGKPASIIFWENVPGVLSTADNAFGCFLGALAGCDTAIVPSGRWTDAGLVAGPQRTVAWRVLDAQFFGLAQRRRRVFVVASAREGFDPAAVLLEWEGLRRDTPPSREAGQGASRGAAVGAGGGDAVGTLGCNTGPRGHGFGDFLNNQAVDAGHVVAFGGGQNCAQTDVSTSLSAHPGGSRLDFQTERFVTHFLRGEGFDASEDGTGRWTPLVPVAWTGDGVTADPISASEGRTYTHEGTTFRLHNRVQQPVAVAFHENQRGELTVNNTAGALKVGGGKPGQGYPAVAFQPRIARNGRGNMGDVVNALQAQSGQTGKGDAAPCVATAMQVRRLTPTECERLQGLPDNYTAIPWRGKPASECPDGPRYKALGNSWAVPVVRWIGRRINERIGNE